MNCAISESSLLSHAQRTPNLKIPAASSYETTIEERNRWLKPLGEKKKKRLSITSFAKEKDVFENTEPTSDHT